MSILSGNFTKYLFFLAISQKNSNTNFPGKFPKNSNFFRQFHQKFRFSRPNWPFTATSGHIILFLFERHHFQHTSCTSKDIIIFIIGFHDPSSTPHNPLLPPRTSAQNCPGLTPLTSVEFLLHRFSLCRPNTIKPTHCLQV